MYETPKRRVEDMGIPDTVEGMVRELYIRQDGLIGAIADIKTALNGNGQPGLIKEQKLIRKNKTTDFIIDANVEKAMELLAEDGDFNVGVEVERIPEVGHMESELDMIAWSYNPAGAGMVDVWVVNEPEKTINRVVILPFLNNRFSSPISTTKSNIIKVLTCVRQPDDTILN